MNNHRLHSLFEQERDRLELDALPMSVMYGELPKGTNAQLQHTRTSFGRVYRIIVSKDADDASLLSSMAHEMRHAWQYHHGKLDIRNGERYWEGQRSDLDMEVGEEYFNSPWEVDAREHARKRVIEVKVANFLAPIVEKLSFFCFA